MDGYGWTECSRSGTQQQIAQSQVWNDCAGDKVAMGIWDADEQNYGVLAAANATSVFTISGPNQHIDDNNQLIAGFDNGVYWYQTSSQGGSETNGSWGFSTTGQTALNSADINLSDGLQNYPSAGNVETVESFGLSLHVMNGNLTSGHAFNDGIDGFEPLYQIGDERVFWSFSVSNAAVPEPSIIALFGLGLVGIGFARRRRHNQA